MKSNIYFLALCVWFLVSCKLDDKRTEATQNSNLVDAKYSVAKDRAEFDKLRESIPSQVKQQNDEKALMADLMLDLKNPPEVVREKFSSIVRKKRELFNKDMSKLRDQFNKDEKKARDEFLKASEEERDSFLKRKVERDKRADFFNDQDQNRRTFFADQRDKREEFESDFREKRKNFEDYLKEKTDSFNAELKDYSARWKDKIEAEKNNADK